MRNHKYSIRCAFVKLKTTLFISVPYLDIPLLNLLHRLNISMLTFGNLRHNPSPYASGIIDLGVYNMIPKTLLKWRFWGESSHYTVSKGGGNNRVQTETKQNEKIYATSYKVRSDTQALQNGITKIEDRERGGVAVVTFSLDWTSFFISIVSDIIFAVRQRQRKPTAIF